MKSARLRIVIMILMTWHLAGWWGCTGGNKTAGGGDIYGKKEVKILITDSGLGGISVTAGLEEKLSELKIWERVELIFFNSLPSANYRYNDLRTMEEKARIFNIALEKMEEKFAPDIILIACNTLSVVYPHTEFSKSTKTKVLGIVEFGVEQVFEELKKNPGYDVIITGTKTTIESRDHEKLLIEKGVDKGRIVNQACGGLESEIQHNPESELVYGMIELYLDEAASKLEDRERETIVALCCSHYGFSENYFTEVIQEINNKNSKVVNPNKGMIDAVAKEEMKGRSEKSDISVVVISRAEITSEERESIGKYIEPYAEKTAKALMNYIFNPELFNISK